MSPAGSSTNQFLIPDWGHDNNNIIIIIIIDNIDDIDGFLMFWVFCLIPDWGHDKDVINVW